MDRFTLMETFISVANHGSFAESARELGVSRALVSKRVQALESRLRLRLVIRDTHRTSITSAGRDYYKNCKSLLQTLAELEDATIRAEREPRGEIRILSSKTFGETILAPLVATFCETYPEVGVHLTLKDLPDHAAALISGGFDLAISTLPARDSTLKVKKLVSLFRSLVAAPAYLAGHSVPVKPSDLTRFNCLDPCGAAEYTWRFHSGSTLHQVRVSGTPRSNSSSVIREVTLRGLGVALLRTHLIREHLAKGSLVPIMRQFVPESRHLYLMYQRDQFMPRRTKLFVDHLCSNIGSLDEPQNLSQPRRRMNRPTST